MIRISQGEFGQKIKEVTRGQKTLTGLCKELETDERTLIQNIMLHSIYDPEVYALFIETHPYKTREREDIDFEALLIEILKQGMSSKEAAEKYNVGVRTIQRRVERIKDTNPELVKIYKQAKQHNKYDQAYSPQLMKQIDDLIQRPVVIGEINGQTEKRLEEIERIYNERMLEYPTKEEAARSMGFTPNRLYKMLNQLYRIKIERMQRKENEFKKSLEVNTATTTPNQNINTETQERINEGEEK